MRMRRTGGERYSRSSHVTTWSSGNPTPIDLGVYYYAWFDSVKWIADHPKRSWLRYPSGRRRLAMKPVEHVMLHASGGESVVTMQTSASNWQTTSACQAIQGWHGEPVPVTTQSVGERVFAFAEAAFPDIDAVFSQHWQDKRPRLTTRLNLSVFLMELSDIKRMFDVIPVKHLSRKIGESVIGFNSWWDVLRYINRGHLNYNFGWRPFLSDVNKMFETLASFEERLKKFISRADEDVRLTRRPDSTTVSDTSEVPGNDPNFTLIVRRSFTVKVASTFELVYSLPAMSAKEMRWRAIADSCGLNLTPSAIWAVLPWSFVVDWFFNVSGILKDLDSDWVRPWIEYHQGCVSRKIQGQVSCDVRVPYGGAVCTGTTVKFSHYLRKVGLPASMSGSTDPLSADKIRLGSSLLLSLFGLR